MGNSNFYVYDETKMTFHKINFVLMALSIIYYISNFADILGIRNELMVYQHMDEAIDAMITFSGFMAIIQIVIIVLTIVEISGFISRSYYAVVALIASYACSTLLFLIQAVVYNRYIPNQVSSVYGTFFLNLCIAIPVIIYYLKRKPLFNGQYDIKTKTYKVL